MQIYEIIVDILLLSSKILEKTSFRYEYVDRYWNWIARGDCFFKFNYKKCSLLIWIFLCFYDFFCNFTKYFTPFSYGFKYLF